jgi:hypothetical protein
MSLGGIVVDGVKPDILVYSEADYSKLKVELLRPK